VSDINQGLFFQKAIPIEEVKDTTGAGDAFWTGFLYAQLHQNSLEETITVAQKLAAIKLQNVGRLPENINIKALIEE
jgi:fructokinase